MLNVFANCTKMETSNKILIFLDPKLLLKSNLFKEYKNNLYYC